MPRAAAPEISGRAGLRVWIGFALGLAIAAAPVFSTVLPPLFDYPNHLARMAVLAAGGSRFYAVHWAALPNLAEDLIVPLLARAMPLALAAKLFVMASFALSAGGALWLNRVATGGWRGWPLLAFLFLYTRTFLWGFLNYLFGVGCALCGTALWLALERRPPWLRIAASTAAAFVCFFSHLAAFGVYAIAIMGVELPPGLDELHARRWRAFARRVAIATPQLVLPAAVFLALSPHPPGNGIAYGAIWRKADLLFTVFDNYNRPFDIVCFAAFLGLILALAATRRLGLDRRLAAALALLAAAYLMLPSRLFSGAGLDHRLPAAGFLLLVAASAPRFASRRRALAIGAAALTLWSARMAAIERVWRDADPVYRTDLAGLDALPRGTRLAVAFPASAVNSTAVPLVHFATLAVARRGAFVPTLFALPGQQPVALRSPYAALAAAAPPALLWAGLVGEEPEARAAARQALAGYGYVAFTDRKKVRVPPERCLAPVFRGPRFQIFAIRHGSGCPGAPES